MIGQFRKPDDLKIELFAAEPDLANPVVFSISDSGKFYVVETFRLHAGVTDTRQHMDWLLDDLACREVSDRLAMYKKYLGDQFESYAGQHDRIRLLQDKDGDGKPEFNSVFATGFDHHEDGLAAGVLEHEGSVYFTCIPDLWKLEDQNGDGEAETKVSLHHGYGVHVGFLGHDLHGLIVGPDGKIYFSIGDRGINVQRPEGDKLVHPDYGTVLRCNPDGTELEVFAKGLRNPQELAFDDYGNLFTGDNNSDGGDKARWVYLIEGSDSGWRIGYQFLENRGIWNDERMWEPQWEGQPAHLVPPILNLGDGPSGLAFDPGGAALPERLRKHFFLADFRGTPGNSGVRSFALQPKGASFELVDSQELLWSTLVTDVAFGPDGALYFSDWVEGWDMPTKGRIYKVYNDTALASPQQAEVKRLLTEDFDSLSPSELLTPLKHVDRRVRMKAQFAMAKRGSEAIPMLQTAVASESEVIGRLHALWALGQLARSNPEAVESIVARLADQDAHMLAAACKVLGDLRITSASSQVAALLQHSDPHVVAQAAIALGKFMDRGAGPALWEAVAKNNDEDPTLRHALVMALVGCVSETELADVAQHENESHRLSALLALRRLQSSKAAAFLNDASPKIVVEAARAIYDEPIEDALAALSQLRPAPEAEYALWRRVLAANFRLGGAEAVKMAALTAASEKAPLEARMEAVRLLTQWNSPTGQDAVVGVWRPVPKRDDHEAIRYLETVASSLLTGPAKLQLAVCEMVESHKLIQSAPALLSISKDNQAAPRVRSKALEIGSKLADGAGMIAAVQLLVDNSPLVRAAARRVIAERQPDQAIHVLKSAIAAGTSEERRLAYDVLGELQVAGVDELLADELASMTAGKVPSIAQLNLLTAARARKNDAVTRALADYEKSLSTSDPLAALRVALEGGDAESGEKIFFNKSEVYCQRCHRIANRGGAVGPNLSNIGAEKNREYLLQAISHPNAVIAKGFETAIIQTVEGVILSGVVQAEDEVYIRLIDAQGVTHAVAKSDIEERNVGQSAMPQDLAKYLTLGELRDVVEYLAGRKGQTTAAATGHEIE